MLRGAAHRGSREGMLQLARCFDAGVGVGADRAEALRWCRRAVRDFPARFPTVLAVLRYFRVHTSTTMSVS